MSHVAVREDSWVDPGSGRRIAYQVWRPEVVRALTVIVHGFGEHGGRYRAFAERLAQQGLAVAVPDLWGHGRSDGRRGDLQQLQECVNALRTLTETVWLPETGLRRYALFGHSFGGLMAISWALSASPHLSRLIAQSPLLEAGFPIPQWKITAALWLAARWPTAPFSMNLDLRKLSRDPEVIRAYRHDPLVHNRMTAGTYRAVVALRDEVLARASEVRVPVLLLCGTADRIISVAAARLWYSRVRSEKRRILFSGCFHELHHELAQDEVLRLVVKWATADVV
ncbi:MAG: lysophospholipase [Candidatus Omnitrophica bacterium]|nr:lysophospholipase [Candidatus Omnitrophota bacterium]